MFDIDREQLNSYIAGTIADVIESIGEYLESDRFTERQQKRLRKQREEMQMLHQKIFGVPYGSHNTDTEETT